MNIRLQENAKMVGDISAAIDRLFDGMHDQSIKAGTHNSFLKFYTQMSKIADAVEALEPCLGPEENSLAVFARLLYLRRKFDVMAAYIETLIQAEGC